MRTFRRVLQRIVGTTERIESHKTRQGSQQPQPNISEGGQTGLGVGSRIVHAGLGEGIICRVIDSFGRCQYEVDFRNAGKIVVTDEAILRLASDNKQTTRQSKSLRQQNLALERKGITQTSRGKLEEARVEGEVASASLGSSSQKMHGSGGVIRTNEANTENHVSGHVFAVGMRIKQKGLGIGTIHQVINAFGRRQYIVDFDSGERVVITDDSTINLVTDDEQGLGHSRFLPLHDKSSESIIASGHNGGDTYVRSLEPVNQSEQSVVLSAAQMGKGKAIQEGDGSGRNMEHSSRGISNPNLPKAPSIAVNGARIKQLLLEAVSALLEYSNKPLSVNEILHSEEITNVLDGLPIAVRQRITNTHRLAQIIEDSSVADFTEDGRIALRKWNWSFADDTRTRLYCILEELGRPTHYNRIHAELTKRFPECASMRPGSIYSALRNHEDIFILLGRGVYGLKKWGTKMPTRNQNSGMPKTSMRTTERRRRPPKVSSAVATGRDREQQRSRFAYDRITLRSGGFIPKQSALKFRLIDLLEGSEDNGANILDRLSQIPLSYMKLPDALVRQLRSVNVFPDDGFDGFACCTLNYLTRLSSDDGWMDLLLNKWSGVVRDYLPRHRCRDISQLADRKRLLVSESSIPRGLGHLPVRILRLRENTVDFLGSVGIKTLSDLEEVSERELLGRTERIGCALISLHDLYWAMQHKQQQGWSVLIDFFDKPIEQFMMDHLRPANVNERDMCIFLMHKGLVNGGPSTLEDIGGRFGITRERVRQVVKNVTDSIGSSRERNRMNLSPLIDLIDSLVLDRDGMADPEHLSDRIEWEKCSPAESFLPFLEFLLNTSPNIHMKNGIVTVWPSDRIDDLLRIVEQHLSECGETVSIEDIQGMEPVVDYLKKSDMKMSIDAFEKLAIWNRRLGITPDGRMGLRKWKWAFPHTKKDRLQYVLRVTGHPMHYTDAHAELRRIFPGQYSEDSRVTLSAFQTYKDVFNLVDHGTYALSKWNAKTWLTIGNAIEKGLKEAGGPLTYSEIRRAVWGVRDCPESNIKVALGQKRFTRVSTDRWDLAERLVSAEDLGKEDRLKRTLEKIPTIRESSNRKVPETNKQKGIDGFGFLDSLKRNRK